MDLLEEVKLAILNLIFLNFFMIYIVTGNKKNMLILF